MRLTAIALSETLKKMKITGGPPSAEAERWVQVILRAKSENSSKVIGYVNALALELMQRDADFCQLLLEQEHSLCDGFGAKLALQLTIGHKVQRVSYPDFTPIFLRFACDKEFRVAILGYSFDQLKEIQSQLSILYPNLKLILAQDGFQSDEANLIFFERCRENQIDALFICTGMPKQERLAQVAAKLRAAFGIFPSGATFLYVTAVHQRGPRWMTDSGFEWLWRLLIEPRRLWRRTLSANLHLIRFVLSYWWL